MRLLWPVWSYTVSVLAQIAPLSPDYLDGAEARSRTGYAAGLPTLR